MHHHVPELGRPRSRIENYGHEAAVQCAQEELHRKQAVVKEHRDPSTFWNARQMQAGCQPAAGIEKFGIRAAVIELRRYHELPDAEAFALLLYESTYCSAVGHPDTSRLSPRTNCSQKFPAVTLGEYFIILQKSKILLWRVAMGQTGSSQKRLLTVAFGMKNGCRSGV